jgi:glycosyltransferase involved in cell wall biosynthesis
MKIALLVHCFFPAHFYGTESYTLELAKNLRTLGHTPVIITAVFPGEPGKNQEISFYEYEGLPVFCIDKNYYPNTRVKDTYYQPELRDLFRPLLQQIQPDILHVTHLIQHTGVALEVAAELGIPAIATFTDFFGFCFNNKLQAADGSLCRGPNRTRTNCLACLLKARGDNPTADRIDRIFGTYPLSRVAASSLNQARRIPGLSKGKLAGFVLDITRRPDILAECYSLYRAAIAPTRFLRDAYLANGFRAPLHLIPFGVDSASAPRKGHAPGAPVRFGFIGQITPHKGVDILVRAFTRLPSGAAELHIFGPSDQDPEFMAELQTEAASFAVRFRGTFPREKISDIFSELDVLVIPSRWYENSPLVLLSALASQTPVVVSDVEGMTEFVEEGKNGWIFPRGSVDRLEQILRRVSPAEISKVASTTLYHRTTHAMAVEVLQVYEAVMGKSAPAEIDRSAQRARRE